MTGIGIIDDRVRAIVAGRSADILAATMAAYSLSHEFCPSCRCSYCVVCAEYVAARKRAMRAKRYLEYVDRHDLYATEEIAIDVCRANEWAQYLRDAKDRIKVQGIALPHLVIATRLNGVPSRPAGLAMASETTHE